jgi:hypothetical protein
VSVRVCGGGGTQLRGMLGAANTKFYSALLTAYTQMLCLCFHVADMAQGQHWHLCKALCTCQSCLFSNAHLAAQLSNSLCTISTQTNLLTKHLKMSFQLSKLQGVSLPFW